MIKYSQDIEKYIELSGVSYSNKTFDFPVLYIQGENDPELGNSERVRMINKQLELKGSTFLNLKNEGHQIGNRENVFETLKTINDFLEN